MLGPFVWIGCYVLLQAPSCQDDRKTQGLLPPTGSRRSRRFHEPGRSRRPGPPVAFTTPSRRVAIGKDLSDRYMSSESNGFNGENREPSIQDHTTLHGALERTLERPIWGQLPCGFPTWAYMQNRRLANQQSSNQGDAEMSQSVG